MIQIDYARYTRQVYGAWVGKCIGGAAGFKQENNKDMMQYTLEDVFPDTIPPNDDFDLQVLWLKEVVMKKGPSLTSDDLAAAFAKYNLCLANEYSIAIKNIELGIAPPLSGTFNNDFFKHSMGCPIRSEIWAMICPGDPEAAAGYAAMDGMIDHGEESIYGEQFFAAMEACAFTENDLRKAIARSLALIPHSSEIATSIRYTIDLYDSGRTWEETRTALIDNFGSSDASYAVTNIALTISALLYGKGDFVSTMLLGVNSGYDTDCIAATACAVLGILEEGRSIPPELIDRIGKTVETSSVKIINEPSVHSIDALVRETCEAGTAFSAAGATAVCFINAPICALTMTGKTAITLSVEYKALPTIEYGGKSEIVLTASNGSDLSHTGVLSVQPPLSLSVDISSVQINLPPHSEKSILLSFTADRNTGFFPQKNIIKAVFDEEGAAPVIKTFGLSGAYHMRMAGPYHDLYDTRRYEKNPYRNKRPCDNNGHSDLYAMFNGYADIDREYIDETFDGVEKLGSMVNLHFDDLEIDHMVGYKGPCCVYLVYDFFSGEPFDAELYIGNNQPCKVWVNEALMVCDKKCHMAMIYNNKADFRVKKGYNRIILKLVRLHAPLACGMRIRNLNNSLHWATELSSVIPSKEIARPQNKINKSREERVTMLRKMTALLLSLFVIGFAGCKGKQTPSQGGSSFAGSAAKNSSQEKTGGESESMIDANNSDGSQIQAGGSSIDSAGPSAPQPPEYKDPEPAKPNYTGPKWDTYSDTWVATDGLGRTVSTHAQAGGKRDNKYVGMLYFSWHPNVYANRNMGAPRNVHDIISKYPQVLQDYNAPEWGSSTTNFWGEPLWGYYNLDVDKYVIKKHAQMLSDIGVDTVIFEFSNHLKEGDGNYSLNTMKSILDAFTEVRKAGGNTPQFFCLTTWGVASAMTVNELYNDIYSKGLYKDLWFQWEGKPLILALESAVSNNIQKTFFTYRTAWADYGPVNQPNSWPWLSVFPQKASYTAANSKECINVSPAQNYTTGPSFSHLSAMDALGNFISRGRSFRNGQQPKSTNPVSSNYPSKYGYNFQEQLGRALSIDPDFMFVSTWNEWIMGRFNGETEAPKDRGPKGGVFYDAFTAEFSRDLEPTRTGGLGDNFYMQLADAIRQFKGVAQTPKAGAKTTIKIDGSFSDWAGVTPEYRDDIGDRAYRDCAGIFHSASYPLYYKNKTGRNDFKLMKTARDNNNIYFYAETLDNISDYRGGNWMRLFIKTTGGNSSWEGYNYVVNRTGITSSATTLEKSTGGWNWSAVNSKIVYKVNGNKLELAIPLKDLGLNPDSLSIEFKWHDNMQVQGDIYEFYLNGDAAPNNRFNYLYTTK